MPPSFSSRILRSLWLKRLFDVVCATAGMLLLSPLLLLVAIWVALDSPGPVIFRQKRVGQYGRLFDIYKFRTMRQHHAGLAITVGHDSRITRSGHVLRRYKIDELPQLVNVIMGDMSLVGPRPEVSQYVDIYPANIRDVVLGVRPGITDLASVQYRHESDILATSKNPEKTYMEDILPAKLELAQQYVRERTIWLDIRIIFSTLGILHEPRAMNKSR